MSAVPLTAAIAGGLRRATCGRTRPAATSTSSALRPRSFPFWRAGRRSDESSSDPADQTQERYGCERRKDKKTNARVGIKKIRVWTEPERHAEHGLNNADALPRIEDVGNHLGSQEEQRHVEKRHRGCGKPHRRPGRSKVR